MRLADLANAASALTLARLLLGAAVPFVGDLAWLAAVYLLAILTDVIDGPLARRTGTASAAGAALDAWADKVLHVNLAWTLVLADRMPAVFMLAWFAREIVQASLIPLLVHRWRTGVGRPATTGWGRATAIALFVAVCCVLVGVDARLPSALTGVLGLVAGLDYTRLHLFPVFAAAPERG